MKATHRVKDSGSNTVGFVVEGLFFPEYYIRERIASLNNLSITKSGIIRSKRELPVIQYKDIMRQKALQIKSNNPYDREIQKDLLIWKNDKVRTVLQVGGPRQVGKTTELLKFAYSRYEYVIYVNMSVDKYRFGDMLESGIDLFTMNDYCIRAKLPYYVNSRKTVLILDEIQSSPKAYNSIRDLQSDLDCDIIVTGSYLGQIINKEFFQSAGTIYNLTILPLSFKEFCHIFKKDKLLEGISLFGKSDPSEYAELHRLYEIYRQIGGYPQVIKEFMSSHDLSMCYKHIADMLMIFENESRVYFSDSKETELFREVYRQAILEMRGERRGSGSKLVTTVRDIVNNDQKVLISKAEVTKAIQWLIYSGIVGTAGIYVDGDSTKYSPARRLYYIDCGLASYISNTIMIPQNDRDGIITETFAYSELYKLCQRPSYDKLVQETSPCFSTYGSYELDFMVTSIKDKSYGIEVKTTDGDPKSLRVYVDKQLIDKGILAKKTNGGHSIKYDTIPIYAIGARFPYTD